jgi:hypothetical protein
METNANRNYARLLLAILAMWLGTAIAASRLLIFHAGFCWQLLGMLDLVTAVTLGLLSSPPPVGILGHGITTEAMNMLPLSDIPTFAVPLLLTLHIISIAQAVSRQAVCQYAS